MTLDFVKQYRKDVMLKVTDTGHLIQCLLIDLINKILGSPEMLIKIKKVM